MKDREQEDRMSAQDRAGEGTPPRDAAQLNEAFFQIQTIAHLAAQLLTVEDAQAVLAEIDRTEILAPMLDPTWYRAKMDNVSSHKRLVRAFVAFRQEIAAVVAKEAAGAPL